jgi:hypothetical protein
MMHGVRTSETTVYFNKTTECYISESYIFHTRCRDILKSHTAYVKVHVENKY